MEHDDQHREAAKPTLKVTKKVEIETFDDKVKPMGSITVENGTISIYVGDMPTMISMEARRDFVLDSIRVGLEQCWDADPDSFVRSRRGF